MPCSASAEAADPALSAGAETAGAAGGVEPDCGEGVEQAPSSATAKSASADPTKPVRSAITRTQSVRTLAELHASASISSLRALGVSTLATSVTTIKERCEVTPRGTYRQIADSVRELIVSGRLHAGAMVPSELALAEEHQVARGTVRSALAVLVDEGLIEVVPGQGRRVVGADEKLGDTAWGRIATALRERLANGEFSADTPLPSEAALMAEFDVSRNTIRRAYRHLVEEGLVVVRHGAGAFPAKR